MTTEPPKNSYPNLVNSERCKECHSRDRPKPSYPVAAQVVVNGVHLCNFHASRKGK